MNYTIYKMNKSSKLAIAAFPTYEDAKDFITLKHPNTSFYELPVSNGTLIGTNQSKIYYRIESNNSYFVDALA